MLTVGVFCLEKKKFYRPHAEPSEDLFRSTEQDRFPRRVKPSFLTYQIIFHQLIVEASAYAARQPQVHLGVRKGEQYYIRDILYSLMLESHNLPQLWNGLLPQPFRQAR